MFHHISMRRSIAAAVATLLCFITAIRAEGGVTTRYWDCCKPSCAWPGKARVSSPVWTCNKNNLWPAQLDSNAASSCSGGDSYACANHGPWAVNENLAYGFAAAKLVGRSESNWCCACYELRATNTGGDLGSNHFDLAMPGGGVGMFPQGCQKQCPGIWLGNQYGGYQDRADCDNLPPGMFRDGCYFRFDWFRNAQNPTVDFHEVSWPI